MRVLAKTLFLAPLASGLVLLALGTARCRLPYENERYFDPHTQVVYHLQAAELYLVAGAVLTLAGLGVTIAGFRFLRDREGRSK